MAQNRSNTLAGLHPPKCVAPVQAPHLDFRSQAGGVPDRPGIRTGLSKTEAEAWLDWLEVHGYQGYELAYGADQGFIVRPAKVS